jgi:hypothetical protein
MLAVGDNPGRLIVLILTGAFSAALAAVVTLIYAALYRRLEPLASAAD